MLLYFQDHMLKCDYALEPCPNHCADILLRKDLTMHLEMLCRRRKVVCEACKEEILLDQKEVSSMIVPNFVKDFIHEKPGPIAERSRMVRILAGACEKVAWC